MKKIIALMALTIGLMACVPAQNGTPQNFRKLTTGNTGQIIHNGYTVLDCFNALNWGSDTLVIRFYDLVSVTSTVVPTHTTVPVRTFFLPPAPSEDWFAVPNNPNDNKFNYGLSIRTTKKGIGTYTTVADPWGLDSYTVSPTIPPIIEGTYH